jgi:hypothetical protein
MSATLKLCGHTAFSLTQNRLFDLAERANMKLPIQQYEATHLLTFYNEMCNSKVKSTLAALPSLSLCDSTREVHSPVSSAAITGEKLRLVLDITPLQASTTPCANALHYFAI